MRVRDPADGQNSVMGSDTGAIPFPAAEGARLPWAELPKRVVSAVEERLGSGVVRAEDRPGGFSPGAAARLVLADGRRAFVKAVGSSPNPDSPSMHRAEARITAAMPAAAPVPRFLFEIDDGDWVALAFEDVDGRQPSMPWRRDELDRVLFAVAWLHEVLTPAPVPAESIGKAFGDQFGSWRWVASNSVPEGLDPWAARHLDRLAELESHWAEAATGTTLLHSDLRADNMLVTNDRVVFVDWPQACIGAGWADVVFLLPSVAMQRGPAPDELFDDHPSAAGADPDDVNAVLAALAGYFCVRALLPAPPGLPTLREFQRAQGVEALEWLRRRTGWS